MKIQSTPSQWPVLAGLIGGTIAIGIGIIVMLADGSEQAIFYALVNAAALPVGLLLAALLLLIPARAEHWLALAAALALLATAAFGVEIEGVRRWLSLFGVIQVQPAFILLPLLLCRFAQHHADRWHAAAMCIAALAIALQPDWSMASPLVMLAFAIWLADRTRLAALVLGTTLIAYAVTFWRGDSLSGVAHVENVLIAGWHSGLLIGTGLTIGALAMLAPIITARSVIVDQQRATIAFTMGWGLLLITSLTGAYPTPLLGYGASAIIGYCLSIIALRRPTAVVPKDARGA